MCVCVCVYNICVCVYNMCVYIILLRIWKSYAFKHTDVPRVSYSIKYMRDRSLPFV